MAERDAAIRTAASLRDDIGSSKGAFDFVHVLDTFFNGTVNILNSLNLFHINSLRYNYF